MFYVYCHTSPSGKRYVGWTSCAPRVRWLKHVNAAKRGSSNPFHCAIRKYGAGAFIHEVLERMRTTAGALRAERLWIARLESFGPGGYNASSGGEGQTGLKHSAATLAKMRAAWTPEKREAMGARMRGSKRPESSAKIRRALLGRPKTPEHCAALREGRKGMKLSDEHKARIGEASRRMWAERTARSRVYA